MSRVNMCAMSVTDAVMELLGTVTGSEDPQPALDRLEEQLERVGEPVSGLRAAVSGLALRAAERRDREDQLRGLLHTAEQLLNVSAVDELLEVIARETRTQLGCDVAHLNLLDAGGGASMRTCIGAVTEAFRNQQTAPGAGLTGRVMTTRSAYVVEDYVNDPLLDHDPSGDSSVTQEGLRTLAAVPLFRGEAVIGVLFASYRRISRVSGDQLSTLASLGSLAALALSSARLHEDKERAMSELRRVNESMQRTNELLEWSSSAHDRLTTLVLGGADIDAIAQAVHDLVPGGVLVFDGDAESLATYPPDRVDLPRELAGKLRPAGRMRRHDLAGRTVWVAPVTAGGELLGSFVLVREGEAAYEALNSLEERTLERAATVCALRLVMDKAIVEGDRRAAGEVVDDLVTGGERGARAAPRAQVLGLDTSAPCVVLQAESAAGDLLRRAGQEFARIRGGLAGWRMDRLSVVLPGARTESWARELHAVLSEAVPEQVWVGASEECRDVAQIATGHVDAGNCLRAVQRLEGGPGWGTPKTLGFVGLLLTTDGTASVSRHAGTVLAPLVDYDIRRGTDLVTTLDAYAASGRSLRSAATTLNVHRNTITQRLERVTELLGKDWQEPERFLELHLALRIHRLTQQ